MSTAQKITPNLWFNGTAKEATDFYTAAFTDSAVTNTQYYPASTEEGLADFQTNMAGKELVIQFTLGGLQFIAINAGAEFHPNPSVSFMVHFDPSRDDQAREHLDALWAALSDGGEALMPLDSYPFSEHYGWVQDRYGVNWQLMLTSPTSEPRPFIVPALMFSGRNTNHAEEAITFYTSLFKNSQPGIMMRYTEDTGPAKAGSLMYADFMLDGQWFAAMDTGYDHDYPFTEGISLSVECKDQAEIDYFWEKLSTVPEAEQCGWCKDRYGLSWQIVPDNMDELMKAPDAYAHMMQMHKIVIAEL